MAPGVKKRETKSTLSPGADILNATVPKIKKSKNNRRSVKRAKISRKAKFKSPIQSKDGDGNSIIKVSDSWANQAYVNESKYKKKYKLSIKENDKFWSKEGKRITWIKKYTKIKDVKYSKEEVRIKWFYDGTLNLSLIHI